VNLVPAITAQQMAEVDRLMASDVGVVPVQLMEVAGNAVAAFTRTLCPDGDVSAQPIVALAGSGGNGGDVLVAARLLHSWGAEVTVILAKPASALTGLAADHLRSVEQLGIDMVDGDSLDHLPNATVVIDGLLGFSATGAPRGSIAHLIDLANASPSPILAIDLPSGLTADFGTALEPCIRATATLTLGLPKPGLIAPEAAPFVGDLTVASIGVPAAIYRKVGVDVPPNLFFRDTFLPIPFPRKHRP
jgi:NAD(P)H-hydrate epimerase